MLPAQLGRLCYTERMTRRFQFSLKWLFVAMLVVAAFFTGIRFERERLRAKLRDDPFAGLDLIEEVKPGK